MTKINRTLWIISFLPVYIIAMIFGLIGMVCELMVDCAKVYCDWLNAKLG